MRYMNILDMKHIPFLSNLKPILVREMLDNETFPLITEDTTNSYHTT